MHTQLSTSPPQNFQKFYSDKVIVGLTGGIGSGKTAVSDWFAARGIDVIDADVVAHQLMQKGSPTLDEVVAALGDWVIDATGKMDRAAVRAHVFEDDQALLTLEAITHPAIRHEIKRQLAAATSHYVILSAPLLLESAEAGLMTLCDHILVVDTPEDIQLQRASGRDDQSMQKIKAIMANQLTREARNAQADDIVMNDGSLNALYEKLPPLHIKYLSLPKAI